MLLYYEQKMNLSGKNKIYLSSCCSCVSQDTNLLELQVPVGHEEDTRVVIYGTIVVTVMGCSFLLYVIAFYSHWKVKVK